jgi:hypothetical protein
MSAVHPPCDAVPQPTHRTLSTSEESARAGIHCAQTDLILRVHVSAESHELGDSGGMAVGGCGHQRSPAELQRKRSGWSAGLRGTRCFPARADAAETHLVPRVDLGAKSHKFGDRGGVAVVRGAGERCEPLLPSRTA